MMHFSDLNKNWDQLLTNWQKQQQLPGLVGIYFNEEGFALSYLLKNTGAKPRLEHCDFVSCAPEDFARALQEKVDLYQLKGTECTWILNRGDYHLLTVDRPQVPAEELPAAIQWLVKDLVDFPIHEASVDFFEIPETIMRDPLRLFVVVAQKKYLEEKAALINASGLSLACIDINALALRHLAAIFAQTERDFALLHLEKNCCSVVILSGLALCLVRQIDVNLEALSQSQINTQLAQENLSMEIRRTLDYCAGQMPQVTPKQIFLLPLPEENTSMNGYLAKELAEMIQEIDFVKLLEIPKPIDRKTLAHCAIAISGALRDKDVL